MKIFITAIAASIIFVGKVHAQSARCEAVFSYSENHYDLLINIRHASTKLNKDISFETGHPLSISYRQWTSVDPSMNELIPEQSPLDIILKIQRNPNVIKDPELQRHIDQVIWNRYHQLYGYELKSGTPAYNLFVLLARPINDQMYHLYETSMKTNGKMSTETRENNLLVNYIVGLWKTRHPIVPYLILDAKTDGGTRVFKAIRDDAALEKDFDQHPLKNEFIIETALAMIGRHYRDSLAKESTTEGKIQRAQEILKDPFAPPMTKKSAQMLLERLAND